MKNNVITKKQYFKKVRFAYINTVIYFGFYFINIFSLGLNHRLNEIISTDFTVSLLQFAAALCLIIITVFIPAVILEKVYKINDPNPYQSFVKAQQEKARFRF